MVERKIALATAGVEHNTGSKVWLLNRLIRGGGDL